MIIKNAEQATDTARRLIGNPAYFQPRSGKREGNHWVVKALIGVVDNVLVTVEMPERLLSI